MSWLETVFVSSIINLLVSPSFSISFSLKESTYMYPKHKGSYSLSSTLFFVAFFNIFVYLFPIYLLIHSFIYVALQADSLPTELSGKPLFILALTTKYLFYTLSCKLIILSRDQIVPPSHSYVKALNHNVMVFGDAPLGIN